MGIKVNNAGVHATIQDLGRMGAQKYGIVVSGAMDAPALRIGNLLVNNAEGEAGIEVMFYGTTLECTEDLLIAITGGDLQPMINGEAVPMWRPIAMGKGSVMKFNGPRSGLLAYIAIAGGIDVPEEIGSKSTYSRAGIGGYQGRPLKKDDELKIHPLGTENKEIMDPLQGSDSYPTWYVNYANFFSDKKTQILRVLKGSEFDFFSQTSIDIFTSKPYTLTTQADRMGYTFEGKTLQLSTPAELLSEGVTYGTIQVPASGKPIILMAERQTTGGYPKIGQVITADLPKLAQLQPHSQVWFEVVSLAEAEKALFAQEEKVSQVKLGVHLKMSTGGIAQ